MSFTKTQKNPKGFNVKNCVSNNCWKFKSISRNVWVFQKKKLQIEKLGLFIYELSREDKTWQNKNFEKIVIELCYIFFIAGINLFKNILYRIKPLNMQIMLIVFNPTE